MSNGIFLSVVIPSYNITQNYREEYLTQVSKYFSKQKYGWEVLFVNDGSTDSTQEILSSFCQKHKSFRLITIVHGGKAAAITAGVNSAKGKYLLFTDFDQSTPISEFDKFTPLLTKNAHVVIAHRVRQKESDTLQSLIRHKLFNLLVQLIALPGIPDSQCGFKAFRTSVAQELFNGLRVCKPRSQLKTPYMGAFDVELLLLARLKHYTIKSVKVIWKREDSKNLTLLEPFKMLLEVLRIRLYYSYIQTHKIK